MGLIGRSKLVDAVRVRAQFVSRLRTSLINFQEWWSYTIKVSSY